MLEKINKIKEELDKLITYINSACNQILDNFATSLTHSNTTFLTSFNELVSSKNVGAMTKLFDEKVKNPEEYNEKTKEHCKYIKEREKDIGKLNIDKNVMKNLGQIK